MYNFFVCDLFRAKEGDNVLDLCCGSGDLAFLLSEKVGPKGKVCSSPPLSVMLHFVYEIFW